jgi:carboxymethylenebutenolidase
MGENVTFQANGSNTPGYLARPRAGQTALTGAAGRSSSAPARGVVVIQEWWGLVPHIRDLADRFAGEGFTALAPDLYHGKTTKSPDEAGKLMMALNIEQAARDLGGAIDFVSNLLGADRAAAGASGARGGPVGVVGFCMGGALSLFAACSNPSVGACAVFYGGHPNVKADLASLRAPVAGFFAGRDTFVSPAVVADLDRQLTALGKRHEFHTYPDAAHAFFNDQRPEVYDAAAAADAWARTLAFFRREL